MCLAYPLFQLSNFNENGCKFPKPYYIVLSENIRRQESSIKLPDYLQYRLFHCVDNFCTTHLNCCSYCGDKYHGWLCHSKCTDCTSGNHFFHSCPKLLSWLHDPDASHYLIWKILSETGLPHTHHHISKHRGYMLPRNWS